MSILGERDGLAVEISELINAIADDHELIEEYQEGDPPSFTITDVHEPKKTDNILFVTTSSGNRFRIAVEVAEAETYVPPKRPGKTDKQRAFEDRTDFPGWENL